MPLREGFDALLFFGTCALGLRASLVGRFCPLAILFPFARAPRIGRKSVGFGYEIGLETFEQFRTASPRDCAALEHCTHVSRFEVRCAGLISNG